MISFHYETRFKLASTRPYKKWLGAVALSEGKKLGAINYIFCDDAYLHQINVQYLRHDTLTDIISFDATIRNVLHGDIFISVERVRDNALQYAVGFDEELLRVMAHGLLHFCGYKDKKQEDKTIMRLKEDQKIAMFHVEQNNTTFN